MFNFGIDHDALAEQLTPSDEKTPEGIGFLKAVLKPFKTLYNLFLEYRDATNYKLKFTAQVIYLEKLLNEQFNNGLPAYTGYTPTGIYISKPVKLKAPVLRRKDELRPKIVLWCKADPVFNPSIHRKIIIRPKQEYLSNIKFIVNVPATCFDVNADQQKTIKMKGWINFYNDLSNYLIVNY